MRKILVLMTLSLILAIPVQAQQKSVTLSTYYPAPLAAYDRMTLEPRGNIGGGIGDTCADNAGTLYVNNASPNMHRILFCGDDGTGALRWQPLASTWTQEGDNLFPSNINNPDLFVGIGTSDPDAALHIVDGAILASGATGAAPASGAGTRFMWIPEKAALRAGAVTSTQWNSTNIGAFSFASGYNTTASGDYSTAMGNSTTASGTASTAMGNSTTASGDYSTAMGNSTTASGTASTAMGNSTTASGTASTAMGNSTTASGTASTAMGNSTTASGNYSTAIGFGTIAQAYSSAAVGTFNLVSGTTNSWVETDPLFVIGNGTDDANRSNALTVLKNGRVGIGTSSPLSRFQAAELINFSELAMEGGDSTIKETTRLGYQAGHSHASPYNVFIGYKAGYSNTTGNCHTFIGAEAGLNNTTGSDSLYIGTRTGWKNTTGINTFVGTSSGRENTTGTYNTFLGFYSGRSNTTGTRNIFLGYNAGQGNTTGSNNVYIGRSAGYRNNGSGNVFIGFEAGDEALNVSNKLYITNQSTSTPLISGDFAANTLHINGTLSKNSGTFVIDHPLDPENKVLRHSFVESPEAVNIYKGRAALKNGSVEIHLPDYFDALNHSDTRKISLTCVNGWSPLYLEGTISGNTFTVRTTDQGNPNQEFSWVVHGVRNDAYIQHNPIIVEEEKGVNNDFKKGEYLNPEVFAVRK